MGTALSLFRKRRTMIRQALLLLMAAAALADARHYSKKNTLQAPSHPYASVAAFRSSQQPEAEAFRPHQPYAFGYEGAGSARQESSDASGRVSGSYRVTNEDGSVRVVKYVADRDGFRADIDTDEPGTGPDSPASVQLKAAAPKKATQFSAPVHQQAPARVTQFSAPSAVQQAPLRATHQLSYPVQQAAIQPYDFSSRSESGAQGGFMRPSAQQGVKSAFAAPTYQSEKPSPYAFEYAADLEDGSISRSESADGSGKVVGSYSLSVADGRQRKVDYLADAAGFRATVNTNEFGTKADSPADVHFYSSATLDEPAPYSSPRRLAAPSAALYSQQATPFSSAKAPLQQAPIQLTPRFSAPAVQQAPVQQYGGAYSYDYRTSLEDGGSSARRESGDGAGRVAGSYSLSAADGRRRQVDYSADADGFRASVDTNEPGTKSDSPAGAHFRSSSSSSSPPEHVPQFSAPAVQQAPIRATPFSSAPAPLQQAPIQLTPRFSAPAVQQAPVQEVAPSPYAFEYESDGSARRESADASGTVTGSYEVRNADGSVRVVQYVADGAGFRANVKTNEPGTKSDSPADVVLQSAPFPARSHTQKTSMLSQQHVD